MEPRATGQFIDDFYGADPLAERYQESVSSGRVEIAYDYEGSHGGAVMAQSDEDNGDYAEFRTLNPVAFSRGKAAVLRARFAVSHITDLHAQIGFKRDATHYVCLDYRPASSVKWRLRSVNGAGDVSVLHADTADANWHTLELRFLNALGAAELVLDGDESKRISMAGASIAAGRFALFARVQTLAALGGGNHREVWLDYWAAAQGRLL